MSVQLKMQCSWLTDTGQPTDQTVITPHFKIVGAGGADVQGLTNDLAAALDGWSTLNTQLTVKAYDDMGAKPNYPLATAVRRAGAILPVSTNRDIAIVLSFFGGTNRPRQRGRLYLPLWARAIGSNTALISAANQSAMASIVPIFTALGGLNVDWVVWSEVDRVSHPVTDWWIDNAWDSQRRRGAHPTSRLVGTTTEGDIPNLVGYDPTPAWEKFYADQDAA